MTGILDANPEHHMYLQNYRSGPSLGLAQPAAQYQWQDARRMSLPYSVPEWSMDLPDWFERKATANLVSNLLTLSLRTTIDPELPGGAPGCGDLVPPGIPIVMSVPGIIPPIPQTVYTNTEPLSTTRFK